MKKDACYLQNNVVVYDVLARKSACDKENASWIT